MTILEIRRLAFDRAILWEQSYLDSIIGCKGMEKEIERSKEIIRLFTREMNK